MAEALTSELAALLRADFEAADYSLAHLDELFGPRASAALAREQLTAALIAARSRPTDPAAAIARLFMLGDELNQAEAEAALPGSFAALVAAGVVEASGAEILSRLDIRPVDLGSGQRYLAADLGEATTGEAIGADHVLGVGSATRTLAELTPRRPVRSALDLGTGSGAHALNLTGFAEEIVATDISDRALDLARFNAALNGISVAGRSVAPGEDAVVGGDAEPGRNAVAAVGTVGAVDAAPGIEAGPPAPGIEFLRGSMLEPIAGRRFDLIVTNPPFVITPRAAGVLPEYTYRDAGASGDDMAKALVTGLGRHLNPGGVAVMLLNWEVRDVDHPFARVSQWCTDSGLDAYVIGRDVSDACEYAETWLRDGGITPERDRQQWQRGYAGWVEDFDRRGVAGVGFGYLVLHRPTEASETGQWLRSELLVNRPAGWLGGEITRLLAAKDALRRLDDTALAATALTVAPDVTEERHYRPGEAHPQVIMLHQGGGFARTVRADTALAAVVGASDGELTVAQICAGVAALTDTETSAVLESVLDDIRGLVLDGFLHLPGYSEE